MNIQEYAKVNNIEYQRVKNALKGKHHCSKITQEEMGILDDLFIVDIIMNTEKAIPKIEVDMQWLFFGRR